MSRGSSRGVAIERVAEVLRMIQFFDGGGVASTSDLARRFEMNQRTVQRWLSVVSEFVPLVEERPYGESSKGMRYRRMAS